MDTQLVLTTIGSWHSHGVTVVIPKNSCFVGFVVLFTSINSQGCRVPDAMVRVAPIKIITFNCRHHHLLCICEFLTDPCFIAFVAPAQKPVRLEPCSCTSLQKDSHTKSKRIDRERNGEHIFLAFGSPFQVPPCFACLFLFFLINLSSSLLISFLFFSFPFQLFLSGGHRTDVANLNVSSTEVPSSPQTFNVGSGQKISFRCSSLFAPANVVFVVFSFVRNPTPPLRNGDFSTETVLSL